MIGEKESKKLDSVSLSHSTVKRHIVEMSDDILEQIVNKAKISTLRPDILQSSAMLHTKGADSFQRLDNFFNEH